MIEIKVPIRLVSEANNTDHWRVKHKRKKKIRALLLSYWPREKIGLPCEITLIRVAPRRLDFDNLVNSQKAVRDFVADKLIPGLAAGRADDDERLSWCYEQEKGNPKEYAIIIRIESKLTD